MRARKRGTTHPQSVKNVPVSLTAEAVRVRAQGTC